MELTEVAVPGFERVVRCQAPDAAYLAYIAIHTSRPGPAVGGTRRWAYADEAAALADVLRLARGMTYKSAMAGLPFGGGKSVILDPGPAADRAALYRAHGRAIEALGGRYVGAEDVGTSVADMAYAAEETTHVAGLTTGGGDPSPFTARGVLRAMQAAAMARWGTERLAERHVTLQGCGNVGGALATQLAAAGCRLTVSDADPARAGAVAARTGAQVVAPQDVLDVAADVFAPCALGGVLDDAGVERLRVAVVCGAANNQLAEPRHGAALAARGILYVPDYVANAGGILSGSYDLLGWSREEVDRRVDGIFDTVGEVLAEAGATGVPPADAADRIAERRLGAGTE